MTNQDPPRVPPLPRSEWSDPAGDVFAYWEGEAARVNGSRSNTMMTLANHPALAMHVLDLGKYFMLQSTLSGRQVKLCILRVAHICNSTYQWTHNALGARQIGVSDEEIEAVRVGPDDPIWSREDRALFQAVDGSCAGGRFDESTWSMLTQVFDRQQLMDLIFASGYYSMVAWGLVAGGVQLEADIAAFSINRGKAD